MPLENPVEMHETPTNVVRKLTEAGYGATFGAAFGPGGVTVDRLARALEQFLLVQVSGDSKFDRVAKGADGFTALEQRGFELFFTEHDPRRGQYGADCFHCHGGPLFTDSAFHNNGLDAEGKGSDEGRAGVTGNGADRGRFRTPSLRNVAKTAPYMHDGRFATLEEAVAHYCSGVKRAPNLDPNLAKHPDGGLGLDLADQQALVAFLRTLSDP
jgi:cytochrome c peroxidase